MIIRPCPFCGEPKDIDVGCGTPDREGTPTWLYCGNCGANGPWAYCNNNEVGEPTKEWNVRTTDNLWASKKIETLNATISSLLEVSSARDFELMRLQDRVSARDTTISRLREYIQHKPECQTRPENPWPNGLPTCDCGYDDLIKEIGG